MGFWGAAEHHRELSHRLYALAQRVIARRSHCGGRSAPISLSLSCNEPNQLFLHGLGRFAKHYSALDPRDSP
jgi:hypothetical protein